MKLNKPAHGFSFSMKDALDANSPRLQHFRPISEKSMESSVRQRNSRTASNQKAFNLAPELTLDDLREKLKNDGFLS